MILYALTHLAFFALGAAALMAWPAVITRRQMKRVLVDYERYLMSQIESDILRAKERNGEFDGIMDQLEQARERFHGEQTN